MEMVVVLVATTAEAIIHLFPQINLDPIGGLTIKNGNRNHNFPQQNKTNTNTHVHLHIHIYLLLLYKTNKLI